MNSSKKRKSLNPQTKDSKIRNTSAQPQTRQSLSKNKRRSKSVKPSGKKQSFSALKWENQRIEVQFIKEFTQPLQKQKIYVEIYQGPGINDKNMSDCNDDCLQALGAKIYKKFNKYLNYVVWQYGYLSTLEKAKQNNIKVVNPLWINECLTTNSQANHLNFPIMNLNSEETLELQKKDKNQHKKAKQSQEVRIDDEGEQFVEFQMQPQMQRFKSELLQILHLTNSNYINSQLLRYQMNSIPEEIHEHQQQIEIIPKEKHETQTKLQSKQLGTINNQHKTNNSQNFMSIAFHKSCSGNIINIFNNLELKNKYQIINEDYLKLKADIIVVQTKSMKLDLLLLNAILFNKKQLIVDQQWIFHDSQQLDYTRFLQIIDIPQSIKFIYQVQLSSIRFNIYKPKCKTQHDKMASELLRKPIEQIIQYYGGQVCDLLIFKIVKVELADIILVIKLIHKNSIKQLISQHPNPTNLAILDVEWLYKSIREGKLAIMDNFIKL